MNRYRDIFESTHKWTEAKDSRFLGTLVFSWGRSDVFNKNHRYYPHKTFESAVNALNTKIQASPVAGMVDHPTDGGGTQLGGVSHVLEKVWMNGKTAMARASILDTQKGRDTLQVIKSGVVIGASLRGIGEVDKEGKVKAGLKVQTVDLVVNPSFGANARIDQSSVIESYIPEAEEYQFTEEDLEQVTKAMGELNDATVERLKVMLEKEGGSWEKRHIKALPIYIQAHKNDRNLPSFFQWFREQVEKFGGKTEGITEEENVRKASILEEKKMAGSFSGYSSDRLKRIEERQKEIDQALNNSKYDRQTISRFYAEAVEAGFKDSKADYIKKFGF